MRRLQDARRKRAAREARKQAKQPTNTDKRYDSKNPTGSAATSKTSRTKSGYIRSSSRKPNNKRADRSRANGRKVTSLRQAGRPSRTSRSRERRRDVTAAISRVYEKRRLLMGSFAILGVVALFVAVLVQSPGAADSPLPIDPNEAGPDVVVAEAEGLEISTPIRPADLNGLGYHPEGEEVAELKPRGKNLSLNPLLGMFSGTSNPEDIRYYVMDREQREGPITGTLDVGADANTRVYAPVTGVVTAVRPDPTMQSANVVEIKPSEAPNTRVYVSLLQNVSGDIGPDAQITAGITDLGSVADLTSILKPQLAEYTNGPGNHVTVSVLKTD